MITLYTNHCEKCKLLRDKLDTYCIDYEVFDDVEIMIGMGMSRMPMLDVDGKMMNFTEALKYLKGI